MRKEAEQIQFDLLATSLSLDEIRYRPDGL